MSHSTLSQAATNNFPVACSICGSPREDNHARRAIRRAGRYVFRRLRCPTCLVTRRFPARDEDQVSENLDASYLAKPSTYIQRSWWQYLPSTNGAEDLPGQVEVWCHKGGPDTKLTAEGGNTLIDQKSKFIFGIPSKPTIYVEDSRPCWGPNCLGYKRSRMIPLDTDLLSTSSETVQKALKAACLDTEKDVRATLARVQPSKRSRFDYGEKVTDYERLKTSLSPQTEPSKSASGRKLWRPRSKIGPRCQSENKKSPPNFHRLSFRGLALRIHHDTSSGPPSLRAEIAIRVELTEKGIDHPGSYLPLESLGQDEPARRSAFRANSITVDAEPYVRWLQSKVPTIPKASIQQHNQLVEQLEAAEGQIADRERKKKERRKRKEGTLRETSTKRPKTRKGEAETETELEAEMEAEPKTESEAASEADMEDAMDEDWRENVLSLGI